MRGAEALVRFIEEHVSTVSDLLMAAYNQDVELYELYAEGEEPIVMGPNELHRHVESLTLVSGRHKHASGTHYVKVVELAVRWNTAIQNFRWVLNGNDLIPYSYGAPG